MAENLTLPFSDRNPETLKSFPAAGDHALASYGGVWSALERDALRLAGRGSLTVRLFTGSDMPVPPAETASGILAGLDLWISRHAQQAETFEVPLDTMEKPSWASKLFDGFWQCVQRFYRLHLKRTG
ncbi:MAG: hypothetical protein JW764_03265 [Chlorobiaceae bacterium]|nr:hypothetical protein [Chlorobiaceae bacterium]